MGWFYNSPKNLQIKRLENSSSSFIAVSFNLDKYRLNYALESIK